MLYLRVCIDLVLHIINASLWEPYVLLVHHISRSFQDNHSIGQLKEQLIVFSTEWSIGLPECIVILQHIDGMMFDRDQRFKDQWVEGRRELKWFIF